MVKLIVNEKSYGEITLDCQTLSEAYDQIIKLDSDDSRYKLFFIFNNEEVGKIKLGPRDKLLSSDIKISDIISKENELYVERKLLITIYDGKRIKKFASINKLNSNLSDIRDELIEKKIVSPNFIFLREDSKKENLQEVCLEFEKSITLGDILKNDVIRVLSEKSITLGDILKNDVIRVLSDKSSSKLSSIEASNASLSQVDHVKQNIDIYKLDYGLSFTREGVKFGNHQSFDFIQPVKFSISNNSDSFVAELLATKRINDFFIIINQVDVSRIEDLPSELQTLLKYDDQYLNKGNICFTVVNQRIELHMRKEFIKPSKEFKNAVDRAINGTDPYLKLKNVFAIFGNFVAQRVILGHKLFNYTEIDYAEIDNIKNDKIEWTTIDNFRNISKSLEGMMMYINKNDGFLTPKGQVIGRNEFDSLIESFYNNNANLQAVCYGNLVAIYEIFEEPICSRIKSILKTHEHDYSLLKTLGSIEDDMLKTYHPLSK
ncbi:252_t:CDS:2, partial [Dentiscutata heterogama]